MLKKRSKTFAPGKFAPRKPAASTSTLSSARPSAEPRGQSRTPAPTQPLLEVAPTPPQPTQNVSAETSSSNSEQSGSRGQQEDATGTSSTVAPDATRVVADTETLKRKTRDEDTTEPLAKRMVSDTDRPATTPSLDTNTPDAPIPQDHLALIEQNRAAQDHNANTLALKRKTREDEVEQPRAKRVSPDPMQQAPTVRNPPKAASQATTRTPLPTTSTARVSVLPSSEETQATNENSSSSTHRTTDQAVVSAGLGSNLIREQERRSPSRETTPDIPRHRYPSPENIAPVGFRTTHASPGPAGMGPPGGGAAVAIPIASGSAAVPLAGLNIDGSSAATQAQGTAQVGAAAKPKRKYAKRKKVQVAEGEGGDRAELNLQLHTTSGDKQRQKRRDRKPRKKREDTPDGAEDEEIDVTTMTMSELCSDLKIGKKFHRHDEIKARLQKQKAVKAAEKFRKAHPDLVVDVEGEDRAASEEGNATPSGNTNGEPQAEATNNGNDKAVSPPPVIGSGPQMRIVDGNLVLDEGSLQINRQKRAANDKEITRTVEENEFTTVITSGTFMKRERASQWDDEEMELFYRGLRMFGTDFQLISQMFPGRNRRQVKLKFNSEERKHGHMIDRALKGIKEPIDIEEYKRMSNLKLEPVEVIMAEHDAFEAEQNQELERVAEQKAEETRRKKATIQAGSAAARRVLEGMDSEEEGEGTGEGGAGQAGASRAKENADPEARTRGRGVGMGGKGKLGPMSSSAKAKRNRNKHSMHGGGEEVFVDGRIE